MIPHDRPPAWDAHGCAQPAIQSQWGSRGAHGAARLPYSDLIAATDTTLSTPRRPFPCALRLLRDALGSLSTAHMRGDLGGSVTESRRGGKELVGLQDTTDNQRFTTDTSHA